MKSTSLTALIIAIVLFSCSCNTQNNKKGKLKSSPNIVLIYIDDMGFADVGCFGAVDYKTPNIDALAEQGARFTNFYSPQAVCSASRAGLLTGCYPNRIGITGALGPNASIGINETEMTIAELLKQKNYSTAVFGKWHLGHHKIFLPLQQGFDKYTGLPYSNDMWPVNYDGKPYDGGSNYAKLHLIEGNEVVDTINTLHDQEILTTLYTEKAVDFIDRYKDEPFFIYLSHSMVHVPLAVSEKFKGKSGAGLFGDVMMEVDWSVGEVVKALKDNNVFHNTLVIFTSDNGPWLNYGNHAGSTGGYREGKGTSWEGGQRVSTIMSWPAIIKAGAVCKNIGSGIDIFPTIAEITNSKLPDHKIDGVSLFPLLKGEKDANPRNSFLFYYNKNDLEAVRMGKWKLVLPHLYRSYTGVEPGKDGWPGPYSKVKCGLELYDLENDEFETTNVIDENPDIVNEIMKLVEEARYDLGDDLVKTEGKNVREPGSIYKGSKKIDHIGIGAKTEYTHKYSYKYPGNGDNGLVDGAIAHPATEDRNWQGFEEDDLEVIIDLGKALEIKSISLRMYESLGSWIFLPDNVEYSISIKGKEFKHLETIDKEDFIQGESPYDYTAIYNNKPFKTRYIRVKADNIGTCPKGHPGEGGKAWLFVDEVVIE